MAEASDQTWARQKAEGGGLTAHKESREGPVMSPPRSPRTVSWTIGMLSGLFGVLFNLFARGTNGGC